MKQFNLVFALVLLAFVFVTGCRSAGPEIAAEPKSMEEELIDKSLAAQGGEEAMAAILSLTTKGTVLIEGMDLPITIHNKRPNKNKRIVEVPMMGMEIVSAFDGTTAWELNPMMGSSPRTLDEARTKLEANQAALEGDLFGYKDKDNTFAYEGEEELAGATVHKLVMTRSDETVATYYLDAETFLPVRMDGEGIDGQTGAKVNQQTTMSDYQDFDGLMWPTKLEIKSGATAFVMNVTEVILNPEIDDSEFVLPG